MAQVRLRTLSSPLRRAFNRLNELRYGVRTSGWITPEELGFSRTGPYGPTSWILLRHIFKNLEVSEEDVFVDYGSGMGRVLVFAARHPFKRVIGVEHSEELNQRARENIERSRSRLRCQNLEVVTADAREWRVPDDVTVTYFFAPFPTEVFEQVIRQLLASIDRHPRTVRVVYFFMTAADREALARSGRVRPVEYDVPRRLRRRLEELWMYDLLPAVP